MTDQIWTVKDVRPTEAEREYTATVEGLAVRLKERHVERLGIATSWTVTGYLDGITVYAYPTRNPLGYGVTVEQAKDAGVVAAHRLYEAGVRGKEAQP